MNFGTTTGGRSVLWGNTHLHTALSMDAGAGGNQLGPEEAYRFSRGEWGFAPLFDFAAMAKDMLEKLSRKGRPAET